MTPPAKFTSMPKPIPHIIIFSHISSERDGATLLRCIASTLYERQASIQYLIISTYVQRLDGVQDDGELAALTLLLSLLSHLHLDQSFRHTDQPFSTEKQEQYFDAWRSIFPETHMAFELTVEGALNLARSFDQGSGTQTLVTGSLYLIGSALRILESHD